MRKKWQFKLAQRDYSFAVLSYFSSLSEKRVVLVVVSTKTQMKQHAKNAETKISIAFI